MWFLDFLIHIWAHFPVLALTDDPHFLAGRIKDGNHKYRFNLINLLVGECQIRLFSFPIKQPGQKAELFQIVRMSEMDQFSLSGEKLVDLEATFRTHFATLTEADQNIEKEVLIRKYEDAQARINVSYSKINVYNSVVLVLLPLVLAFDWSAYLLQPHEKILGILLLYSIGNLCIEIYQALRVRSYVKSSFSDIKKAKNKAQEQTWHIYHDWQQSRRKADLFVSFVLSMQEWIIGIILLSVMLSVLHNTPAPMHQPESAAQVRTLSISSMDTVYSPSAIEWSRVIYDLQKDSYSEVTILWNNSDTTKIREILDRFTHQEIVWIKDPSLDPDTIKIILEDAYA